MADNVKTVNSLVYTFDTETENKSMSKTFTDYNTSVTDDQIRTVGKILAAQELFSGDFGVISALVSMERVEKQITDITQASA